MFVIFPVASSIRSDAHDNRGFNVFDVVEIIAGTEHRTTLRCGDHQGGFELRHVALPFDAVVTKINHALLYVETFVANDAAANTERGGR